jgi:4-hydroxybenzoate polyprenyltransferase
MKFVKVIIYVLSIIVYAYAAWKISVNPKNLFWGYLCVPIFGYLFIWTVLMVTKNKKNNNKNNEENL